MGKSSFFIPTLKSLIIYFTNTFNLFWQGAIHSSTFMEIGGDKLSPKCMNMYDYNCGDGDANRCATMPTLVMAR